jgi:hypothetical protein
LHTNFFIRNFVISSPNRGDGMNIQNASLRDIKMYTKLYFEFLKERSHSEGLDIDGIIILKCILRKYAA